MRPCSESETGRPSSKEMCCALVEASFLSRSCRSWEISPYWPATRQRMSPNPRNLCSKGPICPAVVLLYLESIFLALFWYKFGICFAFWSTAFCWDWYQVKPALIHFSSARLLLASPCSAGKVMRKSYIRPCLSLVD